jgi:hypothetical protein
MSKAAHTKRPPVPIVCWAVIIVGRRCQWINSFTIAPQKRDARKRYLDQWIEPRHGEEHFANKSARLAKVRIEVME